jgi:hypothetical protein
MAKEKKVYYVTKTQYDTLYANGAKTGTLTVGGVTYSYEDDATYFIKEGDSVPIIGALASYAVTPTVSSASTDAQIPTAKAVYSAVASPTKTSFAPGAGGSGVTLTLTAYQYSDGWVHIYGYVTMSAAIGSGGALFSVSSAYYPTEGSNFISYAPFQTSGAPYPSNRIAVGFTGGGMFYNRSTTGLASGSVLYIDTYYRTV